MIGKVLTCILFLSSLMTIVFGQFTNDSESQLSLLNLLNWNKLSESYFANSTLTDWLNGLYFPLNGEGKLPVGGFNLDEENPVPNREIPPPENHVFATEQLYLKLLPNKNSDLALTCGQFIVSRGFNYTQHFVTTKDGYILSLYRIHNPYAWKALGRKLKPVILVHGLLLSCGCWMFNSADGHIVEWQGNSPPEVKTNDLAFLLANLEFDVWLVNSRGTTYSSRHVYLNDKDPQFWDFTWEDMAKYDVPAFVDYVIEKTGHEKVTYIGYSQGNIQVLAHLCEDPSFANKLALNFAIAPLPYLGNPHYLPGLIPHGPEFYLPLELIEKNPFPPFLPEFDALLTLFCKPFVTRGLCIFIYGLLFGPDPAMVNVTRFPVITSLIDTVSIKLLLHYDQTYRFNAFRKFDYGPFKNMALYGSLLPPQYPIENIPFENLVIISGLNDAFAYPLHIQQLRMTLKGKPLVDYVVPYPLWNHIDVIFGLDAYKYLNKPIVDIMRKYLPSDV